MEQCDEREKTQVNNLHLGRDLSRVSDFVLVAKRVRKRGDGIIKSEKPEFYYFP
jgi:hypothetical protein